MAIHEAEGTQKGIEIGEPTAVSITVTFLALPQRARCPLPQSVAKMAATPIIARYVTYFYERLCQEGIFA